MEENVAGQGVIYARGERADTTFTNAETSANPRNRACVSMLDQIEKDYPNSVIFMSFGMMHFIDQGMPCNPSQNTAACDCPPPYDGFYGAMQAELPRAGWKCEVGDRFTV